MAADCVRDAHRNGCHMSHTGPHAADKEMREQWTTPILLNRHGWEWLCG
ncbi:hypothetical protein J3R75_002613 [Oligosphaera ethanolica]|uniref:Uncharacterized protein n=1 Tax=Oligosphaera ethanolica TaxID=760260 RepID=A0AAE3VHH7_9BACT|nr:hypothetical protein [Oligosphaera ethanolica]